MKLGPCLTSEKLSSFARIAREFKGAEMYLLSNAETAALVDGIHCLHWREGLSKIFDLS